MGYKIKYGKELVKTTIHPRRRYKNKWQISIAIFMCAIILLLSLFGKSEGLRDYIFPGNADVTEAALSTLVTDIKHGESLGVAITAFCQEIFSNATFPQ